MKHSSVTIHYRDSAGRLVNAGEIVPPKKEAISARTLSADFDGIPVKLQWRKDKIASVFAPDRESAEKLVATFRKK